MKHKLISEVIVDDKAMDVLQVVFTILCFFFQAEDGIRDER